MSSVDVFYLVLVLVGLVGFAGSLAYFASQDARMRKARAVEELRDARRPAKSAGEGYAKAA